MRTSIGERQPLAGVTSSREIDITTADMHPDFRRYAYTDSEVTYFVHVPTGWRALSMEDLKRRLESPL